MDHILQERSNSIEFTISEGDVAGADLVITGSGVAPEKIVMTELVDKKKNSRLKFSDLGEFLVYPSLSFDKIKSLQNPTSFIFLTLYFKRKVIGRSVWFQIKDAVLLSVLVSPPHPLLWITTLQV